MLDKLTYVNVWVDDQDDALEFYTEKLGMVMSSRSSMPSFSV